MSVVLSSKCAKCGSVLPTGVSACTACGAPVGAKPGIPPRPPARPAAAVAPVGAATPAAAKAEPGLPRPPVRPVAPARVEARPVAAGVPAQLPEPVVAKVAPTPIAASPVAAPREVAASPSAPREVAPAAAARLDEVPSAPAASAASNPFLVDVVVEKPLKKAAPEAQRAPVVTGPARGAPLMVDPTVVVPNIRDPHAEFRRGSWKKPVAFVVAGALVLGGLTLLGGRETKESPAAAAAPASVKPGIGASVAPGITNDNHEELAKKPTSSPPSDEARPASTTSRTREDSGESSFAKSFRQAAKK